MGKVVCPLWHEDYTPYHVFPVFDMDNDSRSSLAYPSAKVIEPWVAFNKGYDAIYKGVGRIGRGTTYTLHPFSPHIYR